MGSVSINPAVRPTAANKPVAAPPQETEAPPVGAAEAPDAPPAEEAAPRPAAKQGRGLFGHFADVFIGGGQAIWDMAVGVGTLIAHPIQTIKGLGYAITHPAALFHAFVDPYTQAIAQGRPGLAIGRGIVEIGSFFITGGSGGAATGSAKGAA
ncbi:MAG: hypothetical protein FJZ01_07130, partial [Candidatus Sericytochromatia bacterium]|nr:hypothetical protein [Candidatus Tanganyikabacteria bacterium]